MAEEKKSKTAKIFQITALLLLTVVLPLASWMYLKAGFNYQKSAMAELKDYGSMPTVSMMHTGTSKSVKFPIAGQVQQIYVLPANAEQRKELLATLTKMHEQFDDVKSIRFIVFDLLGPEVEIAKIDEPDQVYYPKLAVPALRHLLATSFKIPQFESSDGQPTVKAVLPAAAAALTQYPYVVLVDVNGTIRNYYDWRDPQQIRRLIEHTALLMPRNPAKKPRVVREKEK